MRSTFATRPPFPTAIDSTMRGAFVLCPRKFEVTYHHHWKHRSPSVHLRAGAAFAASLETARRSFWDDNLSPEASTLAGAETLIREYHDSAEFDDHPKSLANMLAAYLSYFEVYGFSTDSIKPYKQPGADRHAFEYSFALPIPGTEHPQHPGQPILYTGRFDMVGEFNGGLYAVDEKTTGQLGKAWYQNWPLRSQLTGYAWAAQQFDIPVIGAIIRGVAIRKNDIGHAESIQPRSPWEIDRWLNQLRRDVERMIRCWHDGYWDYALDSACAQYGGCDLIDICQSAQPERWLSSEFEQRVWDPVAHEERIPTAEDLGEEE